MGWEVEYTEEFEGWWEELDEDETREYRGYCPSA